MFNVYISRLLSTNLSFIYRVIIASSARLASSVQPSLHLSLSLSLSDTRRSWIDRVRRWRMGANRKRRRRRERIRKGKQRGEGDGDGVGGSLALTVAGVTNTFGHLTWVASSLPSFGSVFPMAGPWEEGLLLVAFHVWIICRLVRKEVFSWRKDRLTAVEFKMSM